MDSVFCRYAPSLLAALAFSGETRADDRIVPHGVDAPANTANPVLEHAIGAGAPAIGDYFQLNYDDGTRTIEYRVSLDPADAFGQRVHDGLVEVRARVNGGAWFSPVAFGGVRYRRKLPTEPHEAYPGFEPGIVLEPEAFATAASTTLEWQPTLLGGDVIELHYTDVLTETVAPDPPVTVTLKRAHRFRLDGSVLVIEIADDGSPAIEDDLVPAVYYYCGFSPGRSLDTPSAHDYTVPYSRYPVGVFSQSSPSQAVFYGAFVDPLASAALEFRPYRSPVSSDSLGVGMFTLVRPDSEGDVTPFAESVYVAVDDHILGALPRAEVAQDPGEYRDDLDERVIFDIEYQTGYQKFGGSEVAWRAASAGTASVAVGYTAGNAANDDLVNGLRFEVRRRPVSSPDAPELLHQEYLTDSDQVGSWSGDVSVQSGDEILFRLDSAGSGNQQGDLPKDFLWVVPSVTIGAQTSWAGDNFSVGQQGVGGWYFRSFYEDLGAGLPDVHLDMVGQGNLWVGASAGALPWGSIGKFPETQRLAMTPTSFNARSYAQWIERFWHAGFRDVACIIHYWQKLGQDGDSPDHHPQGPFVSAFGVQEDDFVAAVALGEEYGYLVALHENYGYQTIDGGWAYWTDDYSAEDEFGYGQLQTTQASTGDEQSNLSADLMASAFDLEVNDPNDPFEYEPTACYLDYNTAVDPWTFMNHSADENPHPKSAAEAVSSNIALFDAVADFYDGPVFGEGGDLHHNRFGGYYAGHMHGHRRDLIGRRLARTIPDFELELVRPLMVGQGMGKYRWSWSGGGVDDTDGFDRYMLQTLLYGHSGWLDPQVVSEISDPMAGLSAATIPSLGDLMRHYADHYYRVRAVQERVLDRTDGVASITYSVAGQGPMTLSDAAGEVVDGVRLEDARVRIEFDSGLLVYGNEDDGVTRADTLGDYSSIQGRSGWTRLVEDASNGQWVQMTWNFKKNRFEGPAGKGWITEDTIAPGVSQVEGAAVLQSVGLLYEIPSGTAEADYDVTVYLRNDDTNGPAAQSDGWTVRVFDENGSNLSQLAPPNSGGHVILEKTFSLVDLSGGDRILVEFEPAGNGTPPTATEDAGTIAFVTIDRASDPAAGAWAVPYGGGTISLPYQGTAVLGQNPTIEALSFDNGPERVDYVLCDDYEYLSSRTGNLVEFGRLESDGAAVISPVNAAGLGNVENLHLFGGTQIFIDDVLRLELEPAGHCHVAFDESAQKVTIRPDFSEGFAPIDVTLRGLTGVTSGSLTARDPLGPPVQYPPQTILGGELVISNAEPGWVYEFIWP